MTKVEFLELCFSILNDDKIYVLYDLEKEQYFFNKTRVYDINMASIIIGDFYLSNFRTVEYFYDMFMNAVDECIPNIKRLLFVPVYPEQDGLCFSPNFTMAISFEKIYKKP